MCMVALPILSKFHGLGLIGPLRWCKPVLQICSRVHLFLLHPYIMIVLAYCTNLHLKSNPTPVRDAQRPQTNPCVHQDPETPQRLSQTCLWVFECILQSHGSAVACRIDRGSECNSPGNCLRSASWQHLLLKEATITTITPTTGRPQAKLPGGNTVPPINRKSD